MKSTFFAGVSVLALTFASAAIAGENDTDFEDTDDVTASALSANVSGNVNFQPGMFADQDGNSIGNSFGGASGALNVNQNTGHGASVQSANTVSYSATSF